MDDEGGGSSSIARRLGSKRTFSEMAASHRQDDESEPRSSPSIHPPPLDEHYNDEHAARRRRLRLSPSMTPRFVDDGLDFRRPVVLVPEDDGEETPNSVQLGSGRTTMEPGDGHALVDLTMAGDGEVEELVGQSVADLMMRHLSEEVGDEVAAEPARRPPPAAEEVIELEDDDEDVGLEMGDPANLPGANYLALPSHPRPHPQLSFLRRPTRTGSVGTNSDNSSRRSNQSRRTSPGALEARRTAQASQPIDLTEDDEDEVILTEIRQRANNTGVNLERPAVTAGVGTQTAPDPGYGHLGNIVELLRDQRGRLIDRLQNQVVGLQELLRNDRPHLQQQRHTGAHVVHNQRPPAPPQVALHRHMPRNHPAAGRNPMDQVANLQNFIGGFMEYHLPAFDMQPTAGRHAGGRPPPAMPPVPYCPPSPPGIGFTRSPAEDEVVVCPNCGDEMGMGETELKQQIWVIKKCGHAYCAECAQDSLPPSKRLGGIGGGGGKGKGKGKGKERLDPLATLPRPPPMKRCVVPGCEAAASHNSWVHTYLGS